MDIGQAISLMRNGHQVRRPGWQAEYVWYVPAQGNQRAHLMIRDRTGMEFPWTPLQWDLLADDYHIAVR